MQAAIAEFAKGGLNGTSTASIARRAGVSQPYLFQLYPDKKALFQAAAAHCFATIRQAIDTATRDRTGDAAIDGVEQAWRGLVADRDFLLMQMQVYVAAVDSAEIRESVQPLWLDLWDLVRRRTGASDEEVTQVFGLGMLINVLVALGIPVEDHCWTTIKPTTPSGTLEQTDSRVVGDREFSSAIEDGSRRDHAPADHAPRASHNAELGDGAVPIGGWHGGGS